MWDHDRDAIRYALSGRMPRLDRAAQICDALGLELYVGPPRADPQYEEMPGGTVPASGLVHATRELVRLVCEAGGDPIPEDLWPVLVERREAKASK